MNSINLKIRITLRVHLVLCLLFLLLLSSCGTPELIKESPDEILQVTNFWLRATPQELAHWQYQYVNRSFAMPSYRTPQGDPLPGWRYRVVTTRRFFTDQSARIYFRIKDLHRSRIFPSTSPAATEAMRIWPVGATLVLETFSGRGAFMSDATPVFVDCIRKFQPDASHFPMDTLFAGDWCYQRFSADGKARPMPAGASACHQCHGTALRLTGDLVFTVFSDDREEK